MDNKTETEFCSRGLCYNTCEDTIYNNQKNANKGVIKYSITRPSNWVIPHHYNDLKDKLLEELTDDDSLQTYIKGEKAKNINITDIQLQSKIDDLNEIIKNLKSTSNIETIFSESNNDLKDFHTKYSKNLNDLLNKKKKLDNFDINYKIQKKKLKEIKDLIHKDNPGTTYSSSSDQYYKSILNVNTNTILQIRHIKKQTDTNPYYMIYLNSNYIFYDKGKLNDKIINKCPETSICDFILNTTDRAQNFDDYFIDSEHAYNKTYEGAYFKFIRISNSYEYNTEIVKYNKDIKSDTDINLIHETDNINYPFILVQSINRDGWCLNIIKDSTNTNIEMRPCNGLEQERFLPRRWE